MTTERQLVAGLDDIAGVYYFCPGCKKDIYMSKAMLIAYYNENEEEGESPCPLCQTNDKNREIFKARFKTHFRYMADIVCGLSHFKELKVRLIIPEK